MGSGDIREFAARTSTFFNLPRLIKMQLSNRQHGNRSARSLQAVFDSYGSLQLQLDHDDCLQLDLGCGRYRWKSPCGEIVQRGDVHVRRVLRRGALTLAWIVLDGVVTMCFLGANNCRATRHPVTKLPGSIEFSVVPGVRLCEDCTTTQATHLRGVNAKYGVDLVLHPASHTFEQTHTEPLSTTTGAFSLRLYDHRAVLVFVTDGCVDIATASVHGTEWRFRRPPLYRSTRCGDVSDSVYGDVCIAAFTAV